MVTVAVRPPCGHHRGNAQPAECETPKSHSVAKNDWVEIGVDGRAGTKVKVAELPGQDFSAFDAGNVEVSCPVLSADAA